ncbi:MAG: hypothetical protein K0U47_11950 [Epsilonproteobacteria bacterium]|nr:hypothetical protein [Campylobacterota bacterium]
MIHKDAFIDGFFLKHNIGRFSDAMESHSGGLYYYIVVLLLGLMPFSYLVIKVFTKVKILIKDDLNLFLLLWFGFVFLFFSFSGTKLPHYIIYGYTPLFILTTLVIEAQRSRLWLLLPMLFLAMVLLLFPELITLFKPDIKDQFIVSLVENIDNGFTIQYKIILTLIILTLLWLIYQKQKFETNILIVAFLMTIMLNYAVLPAYGKLMQLPVKEAALLAKTKNYKVLMYKNTMPSFNVYYQGLVKKGTPKDGEIIFCKVTSLDHFTNYEILYKKNGFALIRISL